MDAKLSMGTLETVMDLATEGCKAIVTYIGEVKTNLFSTVPIIEHTCSIAFSYPHIIDPLELVCTPLVPSFIIPGC
jgi:hypothetical protein